MRTIHSYHTSGDSLGMLQGYTPEKTKFNDSEVTSPPIQDVYMSGNTFVEDEHEGQRGQEKHPQSTFEQKHIQPPHANQELKKQQHLHTEDKLQQIVPASMSAKRGLFSDIPQPIMVSPLTAAAAHIAVAAASTHTHEIRASSPQKPSLGKLSRIESQVCVFAMLNP